MRRSEPLLDPARDSQRVAMMVGSSQKSIERNKMPAQLGRIRQAASTPEGDLVVHSVLPPDELREDPLLPPVFATPMMVLAIENAALAAIRPYLESGESAVGTRVDIRHLAATPVGQRVTAWAEVTAVSGRRIEFKVHAHDETEEIGVGTHERVVIDLRKFGERLSAKARAAASTDPAAR